MKPTDIGFTGSLFRGKLCNKQCFLEGELFLDLNYSFLLLTIIPMLGGDKAYHIK